MIGTFTELIINALMITQHNAYCYICGEKDRVIYITYVHINYIKVFELPLKEGISK